MTRMKMALAPGREQRSHEGHVQKAEQEQREQHPELETGVAGEYGLLGRHEAKIS